MKLLITILLAVSAITGCTASKPMTAKEAYCSGIASAKANEVYDRHTSSIDGKADALSISVIIAAGFARNKAGQQAYDACMGGYVSTNNSSSTTPINHIALAEKENEKLRAKLKNEQILKVLREEQEKREFEAYYEKRRAEERREAELKKLYTPLKSK